MTESIHSAIKAITSAARQAASHVVSMDAGAVTVFVAFGGKTYRVRVSVVDEKESEVT